MAALLEKGADATLQSKGGATVMDIARFSDCEKNLEVLELASQ